MNPPSWRKSSLRLGRDQECDWVKDLKCFGCSSWAAYEGWRREGWDILFWKTKPKAELWSTAWLCGGFVVERWGELLAQIFILCEINHKKNAVLDMSSMKHLMTYFIFTCLMFSSLIKQTCIQIRGEQFISPGPMWESGSDVERCTNKKVGVIFFPFLCNLLALPVSKYTVFTVSSCNKQASNTKMLIITLVLLGLPTQLKKPLIGKGDSHWVCPNSRAASFSGLF